MIKRTITGLALTAILFLALWGGGLWFAVPCMITTCLSFYEMIQATVQAGHKPVQWPCWLCFALSIPLYHYYGSVALMMPLVMAAFGASFDFASVTPRLWLGMVYMGVFTGGAAFMAWLLALRYVPSSMLGSYGYLSALLAAFLSGVLLHEKFSGLFVVSAVMALGGMAMMMRGEKKADA